MEKIVSYLRQALPYIHEHRDKTMVVVIPDSIVTTSTPSSLVEDLALLHNLGIKLILIPTTESIEPEMKVVDDAYLQEIRYKFEQMRYVFNSQSAKLLLPIIGGQFCSARPQGIIKGVNQLSRGVCRNIEIGHINAALEAEQIIWHPPIAHSPSGKGFLLNAYYFAIKIATAVSASKVIVLADKSEMPKLPKRQYIPRDISGEKHPLLQFAIRATSEGLSRVHFLDCKYDGSLLIELYTRDGVGLLIHQDNYDVLRSADSSDIPHILNLTTPLQSQDMLVHRTEDDITRHIDNYTVMLRDGKLIGCYVLYELDENSVELASLVVSDDARRLKLGNTLLLHAQDQALSMGKSKMFVLTTQALDWFIEHQFIAQDYSELPLTRIYNHQRNAQVLCKLLK